jgi:hypothetical protein
MGPDVKYFGGFAGSRAGVTCLAIAQVIESSRGLNLLKRRLGGETGWGEFTVGQGAFLAVALPVPTAEC